MPSSRRTDERFLRSFRPIAPTYLRPALLALLTKRFPSGGAPSKDVVNLVVDSSNGDVRSAVMALQFACASSSGARAPAKGQKKRGGTEARALVEVVTRREQSLALFHLLGKLFYNKRESLCGVCVVCALADRTMGGVAGKGDPPGASTSAKDLQRDRLLDAQLRNEPPLPAHLQEHARRPSRVDVEVRPPSPFPFFLNADLGAIYRPYTQTRRSTRPCSRCTCTRTTRSTAGLRSAPRWRIRSAGSTRMARRACVSPFPPPPFSTLPSLSPSLTSLVPV